MRTVKTQNELVHDFREDEEEMDTYEITMEELEEESIDLEDDDFNLDFETEGDEEYIEMDEDSGEDIDDEEQQEDEEVDMEQQEEQSSDDEEPEEMLEEFEIPIGELIPSISNPINRITEAGVLSVVNSKNGKRVSIAKEVMEQIGQPTSIQIGFVDTRMVIGEYLGEAYTSYEVKVQGTKRIIYNKDLVEQITNHYKLDFSSRTSVTFSTATYKRMAGERVAIITMV